MTEAKEVSEKVAESSTPSVGIKETQDAVKGAGVLLIFILQRLRDGAGLDDVMAIFAKFQTDLEFKKVLSDAYNGADKIKGEVKDVTLIEGLALGKDIMDLVPQILDSLKKENVLKKEEVKIA